MRHVVSQVEEERLIFLISDPFHGLLCVSFREEFLIYGKLDDFLSADQWHRKRKFVNCIKDLASLLLPRRRRDIVATRSSKMIVKSTILRMHQRFTKIFRVTGKVPLPENCRRIALPLEHRRHQCIPVIPVIP